ncbi:MAG TPA: anti-sigma factor [Blastocatellia bacterium]|nr:anti-sigma factor [Blastocatellia bacterium]
MGCADYQEQLSDYIDGALELGEQTRIEHHLAHCESCRIVRDDLLQIVHFSNQLPLQAPPASLWSRIQQDIEQESPPTFSSRLRTWWMRTISESLRLSIPQLALTATAIIVLAIGGIALLRKPSVDSNAASTSTAIKPDDRVILSNADITQIEDQVNRLTETVEKRKDSWDPEIRESFEKNLYYINQSLVECRHQLNDNPTDDIAQELMLNAYREKVRLLEGFKNF